MLSSFFIFTQMKQFKPIGIFDSGVGGTSIWKEIQQLLPQESTIYLADSKNAPYGNKSAQEIIRLSKKNTEKLLEMGCKLIIVACNTATTNAISVLRKTYSVPFIGIEPAIKPAALKTKTKNIGVLATKGTFSSNLFSKTSEFFSNGINSIEVVGEGLVPLIEEGRLSDIKTKKLLKQYLLPMMKANIDYLVLGCSHYPYLIPEIKKIVGIHVTIIDSGEAVARQTKVVLKSLNLATTPSIVAKHLFYSNGNTVILKELLKDYKEKINIEKLDF